MRKRSLDASMHVYSCQERRLRSIERTILSIFRRVGSEKKRKHSKYVLFMAKFRIQILCSWIFWKSGDGVNKDSIVFVCEF